MHISPDETDGVVHPALVESNGKVVLATRLIHDAEVGVHLAECPIVGNAVKRLFPVLLVFAQHLPSLCPIGGHNKQHSIRACDDYPPNPV